METAFALTAPVLGSRGGRTRVGTGCSRRPTPQVWMSVLPPDHRPDVAIIGGGAAGLSTALSIAMRGASVKVLSRAPDEAAFRAAAGMLVPNCEEMVNESMRQLAQTSRGMYPEYVEMLERVAGMKVGYTSKGDVLFPLRSGERAPPHIQKTGRFLDAAVLKDIEPALGPEISSAYQVPGDGHIDNRALFRALEKACAVMGVNIELGAEVCSIVASPDGSTIDHLLLTSGERVVAGHFVAAAGAWTQGVLPNVPIKPVKGQMLCLEPRTFVSSSPTGQAGDASHLKHLLFGQDIYVVPKHDGKRFFVGATVEEDAGFDRETTAGAVHSLLSRAMSLVPQFQDFHLAESWAGLRPAAPDRLPVLGMSEFKNMSVSSGFYRNGVLLLPATAEIAAATALDDPGSLSRDLSGALESFSCSRFSTDRQVSKPTNASKSRSDDARTNVASKKEKILLYRVLPDGSREPVFPGKTPSIFSQGAGDMRGEEKITARKRSAPPANDLNRRSVAASGPASQDHDATASSDAYDDIMKHRGKGSDEKMKIAMEKNRSFGVTPRPGREGEVTTLDPWEWDALDAAHELGRKEGLRMELSLENAKDEKTEVKGNGATLSHSP